MYLSPCSASGSLSRKKPEWYLCTGRLYIYTHLLHFLKFMEKVSIKCCLAVSENELKLPCNSPSFWFPLYNLSFSTAEWRHPVWLVLLVPMREGLPHGGSLAEWGGSSSLGLPLGKAGWAAHKCPHLVECVLADHNPRRVRILQVASFTTTVALTTERLFQLWPQGSQQERCGRLSHFLYASTTPRVPAYPNTPRGITLARAQSQRTGWPKNLFVCSFSK